MHGLKTITNDIQFLSSMDQFVSAYQELTVFQMRQRRDAIVNSRAFTNGLLDVFVDLKQSIKGFLEEQVGTGAKEVITLETLQKNDKHAAVFLTFDTKFAGQTMRAVFAEFQRHLSAHPEFQPVVVGEIGKWLFEEHFGSTRPYQYFALTERSLSDDLLLELTKQLLQFGHITVFNPYFLSLIDQVPSTTNLTGDIPLVSQEIEQRMKRRFLYEPSGEAMLSIFERQIMAALLKQTVRESLLAVLGARITTLESTRLNVDRTTRLLKRASRKQQRAQSDTRQRERMAGSSLW